MAIVVGALSGGHQSDPRTPAGLRGLASPLFGVAVIGNGGRAAAIDAYGNVVDLRGPGPAGPARVAVSARRQAARTAAVDEALIARLRLRDGRVLPLWRAGSVRQRYLPGSNVLRTVARVGVQRFSLTQSIGSAGVDCRSAGAVWLETQPCAMTRQQVRELVQTDRRWLSRARPLGSGAPRWARAIYRRSLLVLRALSDRHSGAVAAGARDGWAYVWPRDAAAVAMAFAVAGYRQEAQQVARFLTRLDLDAAARFRGTGAPVPGRGAQGDAAGWVAAAARVAGLERRSGYPVGTDDIGEGHALRQSVDWRRRADYQEGDPGNYLGNAIAATVLSADGPDTGLYRRSSTHRRHAKRIAAEFETERGLVRAAGNPGAGLDSSAAWAVRPFPIPALYPAVRRTLFDLVANHESRFGLVPSERWSGGEDPWTAPTAWTAWALAALAREDSDAQRARSERRAALLLLGDLRRASTPLGLLPERVDARTGAPASTTPLAWSHAFAILALHELWPTNA